ncbi:MAG TPA: hypothetical protein VK589_30040 [Chryseolinea sp.]|nr:hypothetical protein [Chryseolinea sp.]
MSCLIFSVICFVSGCLAAGYFFRRHQKGNEERFIQQDKELEARDKELEARKRALQEIIYGSHHIGANPRGKRIRGAVSVIRLSKDPKEHLYWLKVIEDEALTIEMEVLNTIKEFEHLQ